MTAPDRPFDQLLRIIAARVEAARLSMVDEMAAAIADLFYSVERRERRVEVTALGDAERRFMCHNELVAVAVVGESWEEQVPRCICMCHAQTGGQ